MLIDKCYQALALNQAPEQNNPDFNVLLDVTQATSPTLVKIMWHFFNYHAIYRDNIHISQGRIAKSVGISLRDMNRKIGQLYRAGLIDKIRDLRKPFATCHYKLTPLAHQLKARIMTSYNHLKGIAFAMGVGISFNPIPVTPRFGVLYSYKDNSYRKTVDEQSQSLSFKVYSIYAKTKKRREYVPPHHYPTENRVDRPPTKKESVMEQPSWVTPTLKSVTETLNLTRWGQIRLCAYPDQALFHALTVLKASKSKKQDLFRWFGSVCNEWCQKNNKQANWPLMHKLATELEMPGNPTLIMEAKPLEIPKQRREVVPAVLEQATQQLRQKNRDRVELKDVEDIERERAYLAANPEWVAIGLKLGVDMSRWSIEEQTVEAIEVEAIHTSIDNDVKVWDNVAYEPVDESAGWDEVLD